MKPTVATCQFPVSSDARKNFGYVERQVWAAADRGADVAHLPGVCRAGRGAT